MIRKIAATTLAAIALACASIASDAQQSAGPGNDAATQKSTMQERVVALVAQCPAVPHIPAAEAAKLPIDVTRWGTSGPRVLIVHGGVQGGLGGGPSNFAKQKVLGDQGWRLEVVDRPGFGKSPTRGVDDMEADSVWIADMLGDGANLVAHSWGGAEALLAAARRPQAVKSLILIEPAVRVLLASDPTIAQNPAIKADTDSFVSTLTKAKTPGAYGIAFAQSLSKDGKLNPAAALLESDPKRATAEGCALLQARQAPFPAMKQAAETVAKAGIPTLIITGGWNPLYDAGADILAKLTHGRHVIVKSPTHFVQLANADDFNKVVVDFMREADSRTQQPATR